MHSAALSPWYVEDLQDVVEVMLTALVGWTWSSLQCTLNMGTMWSMAVFCDEELERACGCELLCHDFTVHIPI